MPIQSPKKLRKNADTRNGRRVAALIRIQRGTLRAESVLTELRVAGLIDFEYDRDTGKPAGPVIITAFGHAFLKYHTKGDRK